MPGQDSTEQYNTIQYITVHDKLRNVIRKMRGSENSKVMRSHNQKKNYDKIFTMFPAMDFLISSMLLDRGLFIFGMWCGRATPDGKALNPTPAPSPTRIEKEKISKTENKDNIRYWWAEQRRTRKYNTTQHNTTQHNTTQNKTTKYQKKNDSDKFDTIQRIQRAWKN